jgi:hypothetical protein
MAEIEQPHLGFVEPAWLPFEFGGTDLVHVTIAQSSDHELVQVIVPPTKGGLDHLVQITQVKGPRDDDPSPDLWLNISKRNANLYRVRLDKGHNASMPPVCATGTSGPRTFGRTPRPWIEFSCGRKSDDDIISYGSSRTRNAGAWHTAGCQAPWTRMCACPGLLRMPVPVN